MTRRRNRTLCGRRLDMANTVLKPSPGIVEAVDSANPLQLFGHASFRYCCNQLDIGSFLWLGPARDEWSSQGQAMLQIVARAVALHLHVHRAAHAQNSDRLRCAQRSDDVNGRTSPRQVSRTVVREEQVKRSG